VVGHGHGLEAYSPRPWRLFYGLLWALLGRPVTEEENISSKPGPPVREVAVRFEAKPLPVVSAPQIPPATVTWVSEYETFLLTSL